MIKPEHIARAKCLARYAAERGKEPSSWIGVSTFCIALGLHPSNEVVQGIGLVGSGLCALMAYWLKDA